MESEISCTIDDLADEHEAPKKYKKNKCKYYCKKFDMDFMKPFFVHKYSRQDARRKDEFVNLFMTNGKEL